MTIDRIIDISGIVAGVFSSLMTLVAGVLWGQRIERRREESRSKETFDIKFRATTRGSSVPPFGSGEMWMAIDLSLTNTGAHAVYLKSAFLRSQVDSNGTSQIGFVEKLAESKPLELKPGEPYITSNKGGLKRPNYPPDWASLREMEFKILLKVCKPNSSFVIETSRGTYAFPATEVCGEDFEAWPSYFPPAPEMQKP